jgi:hypothetical protein
MLGTRLLPLAIFAAAPAFAQSEPAQPVEPPVAAPVVEPPPPAPKKKGIPASVTYDGGTIIRSDDGNFELKINGLLQTRLEWNSVEDGATTTKFLETRARLALAGFVWKDTQFKVETAFSDTGNTRLRDFYLNQVLMDGNLQIRAGQFKRPFNRQEIVSDFATEFVEKAITNTAPGVEGGRDIGVALTNGYEKSPDGIEWIVGIYNGAGDTSKTPATCSADMTGKPTCTIGTPTSTPADWQPQLVARVGYNMGGIKGYSEADLEGGPFRLAVAAAYRAKNLQDMAGAPLEHGVEGDFMLKIEGFDATGMVFMRKVKDVDAQLGLHVQAGYMVLPKEAQVAVRFAMTPDAAPAAGAKQTYVNELRAAFSYYFSKSHNFKWVSDVGYLKDTADGAKATLNIRTGAQLIF